MSFMSTESIGLNLPPMEEGVSEMERILVKGKVIPYTTVADVALAIWSDDFSFYQNWLTSRENSDVHVGPWTVASSEDPIEYKDENFEKKRIVTFKSPRTISSVTSPEKDPSKVLVNVEEIQHYRMQDERIVVATQVKQTNLPFGESFIVHWRWVATNLPPKRVVIRVGFSIEFIGEVLVAEKLRKQQGDLSAQRHVHLFRAMKEEMASRQLVLSVKDPWYNVVNALRVFFPFWAPHKTVSTVPRMVGKVLEQLRLIEMLPSPKEKTINVRRSFRNLKASQERIKVLLEREKAWVRSALPEEIERESRRGNHQNLPPFLVPLADTIGKLHVINPFDKHRRVKEILSETDNAIVIVPYTDPVLEKMTLVASKTIFECTVEDVMKFMTKADKTWYESWMTNSGRIEVDVPEWTEYPIQDHFSGEMFSHSRMVTCRFERSTYNNKIEKSVMATQKQSQYCRYDAENSAFIWTITTSVDGMAFSDSWQIHVRWVVSRTEEKAVQIKIGYSLEILKPIMVESQLRADALTNVQERQIKLMTAFRDALKLEIEASKRKHPVVETIETSVAGAVNQVQRWINLYPEKMLRDDPSWQVIFLDIRKKLESLVQTLRCTGSEKSPDSVQEEARYVFLELEQIRDAFEEVVKTMSDSSGPDQTFDEDITSKLVLP